MRLGLGFWMAASPAKCVAFKRFVAVTHGNELVSATEDRNRLGNKSSSTRGRSDIITNTVTRYIRDNHSVRAFLKVRRLASENYRKYELEMLIHSGHCARVWHTKKHCLCEWQWDLNSIQISNFLGKQNALYSKQTFKLRKFYFFW